MLSFGVMIELPSLRLHGMPQTLSNNTDAALMTYAKPDCGLNCAECIATASLDCRIAMPICVAALRNKHRLELGCTCVQRVVLGTDLCIRKPRLDLVC